MSETNIEARYATDNRSRGHAYPSDLGDFVLERWEGCPQGVEETGCDPADPPEPLVLEELLSACYQASLLREEERPVIFRALYAAPDELPEGDGPPYGLHRVEFNEPRPFNERELRRLSPAADFERSLIGVCCGEDGEMKIWGIVSSGLRWLQSAQGGRELSAPLPPVPVVKVNGPGRLMVKKGSAFVAELSEGRITGSRSDVFTSRWLADHFLPIRDELLEEHREALSEAAALGETWARLDPDLPRTVARQMVKRLVSAVRDASHGATIVIAPPDVAGESSCQEQIVFKHTFTDGKLKRRFCTLIVQVMNRLARIHGGDGGDRTRKVVGWAEYTQSRDRELAELDEAIFEFAHLVAGLAAVDGAVVVTQRFELVGMGGEISGDLPDVQRVRNALDDEGDEYMEDDTHGVGTRHHSAYRLAAAFPETLALVFSQDGGAHFVKSKDDMVTIWDQA